MLNLLEMWHLGLNLQIIHFIQAYPLLLQLMPSSLGDVLNIQDLKVSYPNSTKWILDGFNLNLAAGERLALIGSSGSGKSTVAKALMLSLIHI